MRFWDFGIYGDEHKKLNNELNIFLDETLEIVEEPSSDNYRSEVNARRKSILDEALKEDDIEKGHYCCAIVDPNEAFSYHKLKFICNDKCTKNEFTVVKFQKCNDKGSCQIPDPTRLL